MQRLVIGGTWRQALRSTLRRPANLLRQTGSFAAPPSASPHSLRGGGGEPRATRWLGTSAPVWTTAKQTGPGTQTSSPTQTPGTQPTGPSTLPPSPAQGPVEEEVDPLQDRSEGLVQRFQRTLKQYGKVMVPVHLLTSSLWIGTFYCAAMKGVNVVPFLELVGFPERLVKLLENSQSGYALTAYTMYKLATPARYTVTLGATSLSVKYLRRHGYMTTPPAMTEYLQDKMEETRGRLHHKMEDAKDKLSERLQETKDKVSFRKKPE